jgi:hypothetical protein
MKISLLGMKPEVRDTFQPGNVSKSTRNITCKGPVVRKMERMKVSGDEHGVTGGR